jgi:precorrin-4/cobalt-precorrin-4 C11-methyltransferase
VSGRASPVPDSESLANLGKSGATLCIFLSGPHLRKIVADLRLHYPADTPVALVYRATWPDERSHRSTLGRLLSEVKAKEWRLTTLLLVGRVLSKEVQTESRLYAKDYPHIFRKVPKKRKGGIPPLVNPPRRSA